jgi:predicted dehydrogenase
MEPLRIGTLGAARITPAALIRPAAKRGDAVVVAVAARDRAKAERFAAKRDIPRVHDSYAALIADPEVEAIYNPLPNGLHGHWTIAALEAGKHVLCEKPFTANAEEAEAVAAVAERTGLVVMEAFHYRYHPLARRVREILDGDRTSVPRRHAHGLPAPDAQRHPVEPRPRRRLHHGHGLLHGAPAPAVGGRGADGHDSNCQAAFTGRRPLDARRDDLP